MILDTASTLRCYLILRKNRPRSRGVKNELEFLAENLPHNSRFSKACYHRSWSRTPTHPPRAGILHRSINRSWIADSPVQRMGYQTTLLVQSPYYTQDLFTKNSDVHSRNFPLLNKNLACPKYERNRQICDNNKSQRATWPKRLEKIIPMAFTRKTKDNWSF